ncbi:MAG: phosphotransferase [Acidobacteriota bacterium]|nr:phosphotransferase [Acidobacteriota bacterium]
MKPFRKLLYDEQLARLGQVVDTLLPRYGLSPIQRTLLQYENNAVYCIVTSLGEQFVVRVATTWGRSEEEQRSEMQWLEALRRETSLAVPEPVHNLEGDLVTTIVTEGIAPEGTMEAHPCVVFRWMLGEPPKAGLAPKLMERMGAFTAEMHRCSERFAPDADFVRPRWDWERLFGAPSILRDENVMTTLTSQQREVLHAAGEQIRRALSCRGKQALCLGHIHADLHSDNILINDSAVGVIDFDDCGFGYYLFDIACVLDSFQRRVFVDQAEYREGAGGATPRLRRHPPLTARLRRLSGHFPGTPKHGNPRLHPAIEEPERARVGAIASGPTYRSTPRSS